MMLQLEEVTKRFGGVTAVDGVTLGVKQSEILGLIGPNGAGKTTLLNVVSGFERATAGKVIFEGRDITRSKPHEIAALGVGRNFQSSLLFADLPVFENVFMACHMRYTTGLFRTFFRSRSARKEETSLRRQGEELLERMGLGDVKAELAGSLPHGHQRILGVAVAMATQPRLLLLDEPMTGMNENEIQTMTELVQGIRDSGVTIIMIEHNVDAVTKICDRIAVLNYGHKIAEDEPSQVVRDPAVIDAYLGST